MPGQADPAGLTPLESALLSIVNAVERQGSPYMVIGGAALNCWGFTRPTKDLDLTVWVEPEQEDAYVAALAEQFEPRVPDPGAFVKRSRVLLLRTPDGVGIDLTFGSLPFERSALDRAVTVTISGHPVRVAGAADLALQKALAGRPQDLADLRFLLGRHPDKIDRTELDRQVRELAAALARPDLLRDYLRCWED